MCQHRRIHSAIDYDTPVEHEHHAQQDSDEQIAPGQKALRET
jgi:hypothetical protein